MNLVWFGLGIVGAVAIGEMVLSARWNRSYFTFGIPIFARRIERTAGLDRVPLAKLEKSAATVAGTPLVFRPLGQNLIAFREKAFGGVLHYTPVMRGAIKSRPEESFVTVVGLVNWSVITLAVVLVALLRRSVVIVAPYFLAAFSILYFIQAVRFFRVAAALREERATSA